jgi:hypothetical protein
MGLREQKRLNATGLGYQLDDLGMLIQDSRDISSYLMSRKKS